MTAPFQVYSASAGAGKTYKLVQRYLEKALAGSANQFLAILAITFTRKAAKEMKDRVLKALYGLAYEEDKEEWEALREDLSSHLEVSRTELATRAEGVLGRILHQYSGFAISTIDSFTDRLIRSFSRDLGLHAHFQVELQNQVILREAVDHLLEEMVPGEEVEKILMRYIQEQLMQDKGAYYGKELVEGGSDLFSEDALRHLELLEDWQAADFLGLHQKLRDRRRELQSTLQSAAQGLLQVFEEQNIADEDINGKRLLGKIRKVASSEQLPLPFPPISPSNNELKMLSGEKELYTKGNKQAIAKIQPVEELLFPAMQSFLETYHGCMGSLALLEALGTNFFKTAVLTEINSQVQDIQSQTGRIPIGSFNKIISDALRDQPAPFLYERLGDQYRHFFIDEFQDTSRLQWQNLLPLIHESLSQGSGSTMIVGDAKQAIYRFRGGDVEQFVHLHALKDHSNRSSPSEPELYSRDSKTLPYNRRSRKEIVDFNNDFFRESASSFTHGAYRELYESGGQEPKRASGGLVRIRWIDYVTGEQKAYEEEQLEQLWQTVQQATQRNYALSSIAVLVGKGSEARKCARFLMDKDITAVGPDNLNLESSATVRGLVGFLQSMLDARYQEARLPWAEWLYRCLKPEEDKTHFLSRMCRESRSKTWQELEKYGPDWNTRRFLGLPTQEKLYYLLERLEPGFRADPMVQAFLDEVFKLVQRDSAGLREILEWWETTGRGQSLDLQGSQEAVQILTIHKSKGLQFPVVILAFAGHSGQNKLADSWKMVPEEELSLGLPAARISWTEKIAKEVPHSWYADHFDGEKQADLLDNRNKWYVAFTRAREELHILAKLKLSKSSKTLDHNPREIGHLLAEYCWSGKEREAEWSKGTASGEEKQETSSKEQESKETASEKDSSDQSGSRDSLENYRSGDWRKKIRISDDAPEHWASEGQDQRLSTGKKLHYLLADIDHSEDLEPALDRALNRGDFPRTERDDLWKLLGAVTEHPQLKRFFKAENEILTERSILLPTGNRKIPDRLILEGSQVHVLDYKSGQPQESHRKQVDEYAGLLGKMGYARGHRVLVYLGSTLEVDKDW